MQPKTTLLSAIVIALFAIALAPSPAAAIDQGECCAHVLGACLSECDKPLCTGDGDCTLVLDTGGSSGDGEFQWDIVANAEGVMQTLAPADRVRVRREAAAERREESRGKVGSKAVELDARRVSPATRKAYADFWKGLSRREATELEAQLSRLENRARRGAKLDAELAALRRSHPQLFELSTTLGREPWLVAGGGNQTATCNGIGWIGINGKLRCIGKLTT